MDSKLAIAGRELVKGNFGNAITALTTKEFGSALIQPSVYRNGSFFFGVNGADHAFIWGNYNSSLRAYQRCPVVSSIINRQAQCTVNGKQYVMDSKGKESKKIPAMALKKLLLKPNIYQSGREFKAQGQLYKRIYGYCPVLVIKPVGFESDYSKWKLWNIPPWMIQVRDSMNLFYVDGAKRFDSIWLSYMGHSVQLNPDNIFFLKENQISTGTFMNNSNSENVSMFLPDSKILPLADNIDNVISSLNSRGSLTRNRGPQWLLTNDATDTGDAGLFPIDVNAKKELHDDFLQYGIMSGQRKAIITDAKLKLQQVGFNVQELQLLEGEVQDAKFISDGLNFPPYLLGLVDAKFDNQQIAERNLYTNSIIPDCISDDEQWSELFKLDDLGLYLTTDFSHLPALQENIAEQGRGRMYMNQGILIEWLQDGITWNRWRELLGEDTVTGMDVYYSDMVKLGRIIPSQTAEAIAASANNAQIIASTVSNNGQTQNTNNATAN